MAFASMTLAWSTTMVLATETTEADADKPTITLVAVSSDDTAKKTETIFPLVTYKCNTEADIITITNSLLGSDEGASFEYSDEDGTYSPWNMVEIDRSSDHTHIIRTKKVIKKCKLSTGEYKITLEPQVFSRNLKGSCGATISSAITVTYDDYDIKERTPFEDYCHGNSPVITRVTVFGKTGEVKIKRLPRYKFY